MPVGLPEAYVLISKALQATDQFVWAVEDEEAKMYGDEGQNAGMRRAFRAMNKCFDWKRLLATGATGEDIREFGLLSTMLKPFLKHTEWPLFPEVVHAWPNEQTLQLQYVRLCRRLRDAPHHVARRWWQLKGYIVEPVKCYPSVHKFVQQIFPAAKNRAESAMLARVAAVLSQLLGSGFLRNALVAPAVRRCATHEFFLSTILYWLELAGEKTTVVSSTNRSLEVDIRVISRRCSNCRITGCRWKARACTAQG
jgi:hypothetical protein